VLRMEERLTLEEGSLLVKISRRAVQEFLTYARRVDVPSDIPEKLKNPRGVFVTIEEVYEEGGVVKHRLRGCIGYPEPVKPLIEATIDSAIAAATQDPRFSPLKVEELDRVVFEVSVLTPPKPVEYSKPDDLLHAIVVGRDGVIVSVGPFKGLLLPQVPLEYDWDVEEYLSHACLKAGLPADYWRTSRINIYTFQAQVFAEIVPNGDIIEKLLIPRE